MNETITSKNCIYLHLITKSIMSSSAASHDNSTPHFPSISDFSEASLGLPPNYHFEIAKTVARIKLKKAKRVALQFPEGLLLFSTAISDVIEAATGAETIILGDVSYGACCVDDLGAKALGCDFLVHYGHNCLINIKDCVIPNFVYVFVEIDIDTTHLVETVKALVSRETRMCCIATIQFVSSMRAAVSMLQEHFEHKIFVPQVKPLSGGEVLGCTSPIVDPALYDLVLFVADGRFHLESFLITNPKVNALQYDPYKKVLSKEEYVHDEMHKIRREAIEKARQAKSVGLIQGTLGRQGNSRVVDRLKAIIEGRVSSSSRDSNSCCSADHHNSCDKTESNCCQQIGGNTSSIDTDQSHRESISLPKRKCTLFLMSEIFPSKLQLMSDDIDCWVQVACPRLSIDWGYAFDRPLLSPYECEVAFGTAAWQEVYPMDHYSKDGGKWAVYTDKSL